MRKHPKILILSGSIFLLIMAFFHGSGINYVRNRMNESNASNFLKEIMPALFIHPSLHLLGLSALGILSIYLGKAARKVLFLITVLVSLDAILGFYLGGLIPGLLLVIGAGLFLIAAVRLRD